MEIPSTSSSPRPKPLRVALNTAVVRSQRQTQGRKREERQKKNSGYSIHHAREPLFSELHTDLRQRSKNSVVEGRRWNVNKVTVRFWGGAFCRSRIGPEQTPDIF